MRTGKLILFGAGMLCGAVLLRKTPLLQVTHITNHVHPPAEAKLPPIDNETADIEALPNIFGDIALLPEAEDMSVTSVRLIKPYMGPDRARLLAEHLGRLETTLIIWSRRWYRQNYQKVEDDK